MDNKKNDSNFREVIVFVGHLDIVLRDTLHKIRFCSMSENIPRICEGKPSSMKIDRQMEPLSMEDVINEDIDGVNSLGPREGDRATSLK